MWRYEPPLRDIRFVIEEVLGLPVQWNALAMFPGLDAETARRVVEEAGRFACGVLAPLNAVGDREGCRLQGQQVRTPAGYREAYRAFVAAGWPALACDASVGGQGLPQVLDAALHEMLNAANHAWTMYPGLLHGACECLRRHASPELQSRYLPKVVSGEWLATMCLTEAHAGSDLGLLKTRAEPCADGSHRLHGSKAFISGGEHDLTDNIVHLVLAREDGAPPGTRGLSLFLVPKHLPDAAANAVHCDGLEKKMGLQGSATCLLRFEGAVGWRIGAPQGGLAAMFPMMNAARLHVGLQGLGHAEAACQNALRYASERLQMRAVPRPRGRTAEAADPIACHPAIRHNLLRQRALLEGGRLLAYGAAHAIDVAAHAGDCALRDAAEDEASLLTPIVKAFLTDNGFAGACAAQQVFGGHGYLRDHGIEQCVRDSRVPIVYEGTNEIQAIDLLVRKVAADGGARLFAWIDRLEVGLSEVPLGRLVSAWLASWRQITSQILQAAQADAELPYRVAVDYLRLCGIVLLAHGWARMDAASASGDSDFHRAKRETARYYLDFVLPEAGLCQARIRAGWQPLPDLFAAAA